MKRTILAAVAFAAVLTAGLIAVSLPASGSSNGRPVTVSGTVGIPTGESFRTCQPHPPVQLCH